MRRRFTFVLALLSVIACASRRPGAPLTPGFNLYSKEQDIELGRQASAQVRTRVDVVDNRELQNYLAAIGAKLARVPAAGSYPYTFTLINDKSINAFALPGGPVFANSGLMAAAANEAQLAGAMAHEIAHVALRHGTSQASKAGILQIPAAIAGAVLGGGAGATLSRTAVGLGLNTLILSYSREAETEADALGARIMSAASYDPLEMARFFEMLEQEGGSRAPEFLSDHPNPGNRVTRVQAEIATLPRRNYTRGTGRFDRMRQLVAQLPAPQRRVGD